MSLYHHIVFSELKLSFWFESSKEISTFVNAFCPPLIVSLNNNKEEEEEDSLQ